MINKNLSAIAVFFLVTLSPQLSGADTGLLRTSYALDDERDYCIDVRGFGANIRLDAALIQELMVGHGLVPRYKQSLGHNHTSQMLAIGTADTGVSTELIDFIERTIGR